MPVKMQSEEEKENVAPNKKKKRIKPYKNLIADQKPHKLYKIGSLLR